ncbi:MAG: hypothetical protein J5895_03580 [Alphaproteobacteria bacterium]|nr:hypothetical protein [Alphaproteobacteria bacterium]
MNKLIFVALALIFAQNGYAADMEVLVSPDLSAQTPVMDDEDLDFDLTEDAFGNTLDPETSKPEIDTSKSLSQNLKKNATKSNKEEQKSSESKESSQSWVGSLFKGKDKSDSVKKLMEESQNKPRRSNAAVFNVAGVMLKMSYPQAEEQLLKRGYRKISQKMDIPNFIRWRNEEKCRNQGVVGYERLEGCVVKLAKAGNTQYISQASFSKFDTKETVDIFLSSTFTNNKVYRVIYKTEASSFKGNSMKAIYLRNLKVYDFWKQISQKYGAPDNKEDVVWGLGGNKAYLKASTGYLRLEDPSLQQLDVNRMSREDQRYIHTDVYNF